MFPPPTPYRAAVGRPLPPSLLPSLRPCPLPPCSRARARHRTCAVGRLRSGSAAPGGGCCAPGPGLGGGGGGWSRRSPPWAAQVRVAAARGYEEKDGSRWEAPRSAWPLADERRPRRRGAGRAAAAASVCGREEGGGPEAYVCPPPGWGRLEEARPCRAPPCAAGRERSRRLCGEGGAAGRRSHVLTVSGGVASTERDWGGELRALPEGCVVKQNAVGSSRELGRCKVCLLSLW